MYSISGLFDILQNCSTLGDCNSNFLRHNKSLTSSNHVGIQYLLFGSSPIFVFHLVSIFLYLHVSINCLVVFPAFFLFLMCIFNFNISTIVEGSISPIPSVLCLKYKAYLKKFLLKPNFVNNSALHICFSYFSYLLFNIMIPQPKYTDFIICILQKNTTWYGLRSIFINLVIDLPNFCLITSNGLSYFNAGFRYTPNVLIASSTFNSVTFSLYTINFVFFCWMH